LYRTDRVSFDLYNAGEARNELPAPESGRWADTCVGPWTDDGQLHVCWVAGLNILLNPMCFKLAAIVHNAAR